MSVLVLCEILNIKFGFSKLFDAVNPYFHILINRNRSKHFSQRTGIASDVKFIACPAQNCCPIEK